MKTDFQDVEKILFMLDLFAIIYAGCKSITSISQMFAPSIFTLSTLVKWF